MEIKNKKNAKACFDHLAKEVELDDNIIIAILANIAVETGGTFDYTEKQKGRSDPAYGLFQFDPRGKGLHRLYMEYLEHTREDDSAAQQLNMVVDILLKVWPQGVTYIGAGNVSKVIRAATISAAETTKAFSASILRPGKPHLERRLAACAEAEKLVAEWRA